MLDQGQIRKLRWVVHGYLGLDDARADPHALPGLPVQIARQLAWLDGCAVRRGRLAELLTTAMHYVADASAVGADLLAFFHETPERDRS
jgi:hypothetical protein